MMNLSLAELEAKRKELWEGINQKQPPSLENDWVTFARYNSLYVVAYMQKYGETPPEDTIDQQANAFYQKVRYGKK